VDIRLEDAQRIREIPALHATVLHATTLHATKLLVSSASVRLQLREIRRPLFAAAETTAVGMAAVEDSVVAVAVAAVGDLRAGAAAIAATNVFINLPSAAPVHLTGTGAAFFYFVGIRCS
jgi:hypothetical protein